MTTEKQLSTSFFRERMKTFMLISALCISLSAIGQAVQTEERQRGAKTDETVLVVVAMIKNEKKAAYEMWMKDVMYTALYKSRNPVKKSQLKVTRWLRPVRQNADSTWTYAFIMDPIIPKTDYDIPTFLKQEYGDEKGNLYASQYESFLAMPITIHALKQSEY
jgi:hypothetical protein